MGLRGRVLQRWVGDDDGRWAVAGARVGRKWDENATRRRRLLDGLRGQRLLDSRVRRAVDLGFGFGVE